MLNRRAFLTRSVLAAAASRFASAQPVHPSPIVRTGSGSLQGEAQSDGIRVYRGVPFAEPPVGPRRFQAPVPVRAWRGVRDATRFAAEATQANAGTIPEAEDCLYLNIWAPADPGPHPVFVWTHGGGFTGGRSFDPLFDGTSFAQEGIVCVTMAYRLGVFGFLDAEPLLGPDFAGSANNALRDLILALQWLQTNVAAFGGDPKRVTIGGESAGAKLTDVLMGVPAAEHLFQQMISESGGAERVWPKARAVEIANSFAAVWKDGQGQPSSGDLKTAPAADVLAAQERFLRQSAVHFPLRPEVDGTLLAQLPLETIRGGSTRGKRLLLGTNRDESALFIGPHPAVDPGARDLGNLSVEQFRPVEARYAQIYPDMSEELRRIRSLTAEEYWIPSLRVADAQLQVGGPAFVYRFDFARENGRYAGLAYHSSELPFVWDHLGPTAAAKKSQLASTMHAAWCAFIKNGTPQIAALPVWPAYNRSSRPTMFIDVASHVQNAPQEFEFEAWSGLLMH